MWALLSSLQVKRLQNVVVADVMRGGLLGVEVVGGVAPRPHHQHAPLLPLLTPHVPPHTLHRGKRNQRDSICILEHLKKLNSETLLPVFWFEIRSGSGQANMINKEGKLTNILCLNFQEQQ